MHSPSPSCCLTITRQRLQLCKQLKNIIVCKLENFWSTVYLLPRGLFVWLYSRVERYFVQQKINHNLSCITGCLKYFKRLYNKKSTVNQSTKFPVVLLVASTILNGSTTKNQEWINHIPSCITFGHKCFQRLSNPISKMVFYT